MPQIKRPMNCGQVEEREILESYLLDRLSEAEREEFEQHYFECASCFAELQTGLALQDELRRQPRVHEQAGHAFLGLSWAWAPALAAVLIFAGAIGWYSARQHAGSQIAWVPPAAPEASSPPQPSPPPGASLEELARVEPPPYNAAVLRGAEDEAQQAFRKAMESYIQKNYAQAIPGLRGAVRAAPGMARYNFYLGASYLLSGQNGAAVASLSKTITLNDPTYTELAHFYLAKAYLRMKDVAAAQRELKAVVRLHGSWTAEAQGILSQLSR